MILRRLRSRSRPAEPLLAFFGHHKCATQWVRGIVKDVCAIVDREQLVINGPQDIDGDVARTIGDPETTFLCYMNADARLLGDLGPMRGVHVVRDPRDVVVSAYFSHKHSHPEYDDLGDYRRVLAEVDQAEGLMLELERRTHQFAAMARWDYDRSDVLELRMEHLTHRAEDLVPRVFGFLGLGPDQGVDDDALASIVDRWSFSRLAGGREPGEEDVTSHMRKGVAGDWVNHFGPEHRVAFHERYGPLLLQLGYEQDDRWVTAPGAGSRPG